MKNTEKVGRVKMGKEEEEDKGSKHGNWAY
jgi:hypothetical protein